MFGITANLWFPKLSWENEVEVVKQSVSALIGGLGGALVAIVATLVVLFFPDAYQNVVRMVLFVLFVIMTIGLYRWNNREK